MLRDCDGWGVKVGDLVQPQAHKIPHVEIRRGGDGNWIGVAGSESATYAKEALAIALAGEFGPCRIDRIIDDETVALTRESGNGATIVCIWIPEGFKKLDRKL